MLAMLLESTGTRCMLSWMRMSLGRIGRGSFCFQAPGHWLLIRAHPVLLRPGVAVTDLDKCHHFLVCNVALQHPHPLRPEDRENSSYAHKQDIGAATRRPAKGTGLPPS
jgi:hypothetical protein